MMKRTRQHIEQQRTPQGMCARVRARLADVSGESLVETMAAILIVALSMLLLVTAIGTSTTTIKQTHNKMEAYYDQNNQLVEQPSSASAGTAGTMSIKALDGVGGTVKLSPDAEQTMDVTYYQNTEAGGTTVLSYKMEAAG